MSGYLDASFVVRYLTDDPPDLAARAAGVIDAADGLILTDGALTESAYVLMTVYKVERTVVVDHLIELVQKKNLSIHGLDKTLVVEAMQLCRPCGRVSFADALLWAVARSSTVRKVYSFDERFPDDGVEVVSE